MTKLSAHQQKIVSKFEQGYTVTVIPNHSHQLVNSDGIGWGDVNIKTLDKLESVGIIKKSTKTINGKEFETYIKA